MTSYFPFKGLLHEVGAGLFDQGVLPHGRRFACADMELNMAECVEAYGMARGHYLCAKFQEDLQECRLFRFRAIRAQVMKEERFKKVVKGEIPWHKRWGKPYPYDAVVMGSFIP